MESLLFLLVRGCCCSCVIVFMSWCWCGLLFVVWLLLLYSLLPSCVVVLLLVSVCVRVVVRVVHVVLGMLRCCC